MSRDAFVHLRRFAYYEELVIPAEQAPGLLSGVGHQEPARHTLLPALGRVALAASVTLLPLLAARVAGSSARRSLGSTPRPALPLPRLPGR